MKDFMAQNVMFRIPEEYRNVYNNMNLNKDSV